MKNQNDVSLDNNQNEFNLDTLNQYLSHFESFNSIDNHNSIIDRFLQITGLLKSLYLINSDMDETIDNLLEKGIVDGTFTSQSLYEVAKLVSLRFVFVSFVAQDDFLVTAEEHIKELNLLLGKDTPVADCIEIINSIITTIKECAELAENDEGDIEKARTLMKRASIFENLLEDSEL